VHAKEPDACSDQPLSERRLLRRNLLEVTKENRDVLIDEDLSSQVALRPAGQHVPAAVSRIPMLIENQLVGMIESD
jgi:hypothetical protein